MTIKTPFTLKCPKQQKFIKNIRTRWNQKKKS